MSVPAIAAEPVANVLLALVGETWTRYAAALWKVRLPDTVSTPTALSPGASVPPVWTVAEESSPLPASTAPEFTDTPLDAAIEPSTRKVPAATVVLP